MTESISTEGGMREFLVSVVEARRKLNQAAHPTLAYLCVEEYVLEHGRGFTEWSPREYGPGDPRECFGNAFRAAARSGGNLTYVEGYALWRVFPVLHAWNVDRDGKLVDKTWDWQAHRAGEVLLPENYYGVPFPDLEMVRAIRRRSVLDDWERGWPLLQTRKENHAA